VGEFGENFNIERSVSRFMPGDWEWESDEEVNFGIARVCLLPRWSIWYQKIRGFGISVSVGIRRVMGGFQHFGGLGLWGLGGVHLGVLGGKSSPEGGRPRVVRDSPWKRGLWGLNLQ
jgi:hypothetical protein